ncbi:PE domain-containing protein, partial [Mycobacterium avium subsp. hominissuis]|nr:PE domain-containing protein [Mycobacterium avium subsp. hominissuis]
MGYVDRGGIAMMFIEAPALAAQAASEGAGGATTAATLAAGAPAMGAVLPMGGEEVSAMFAQAIAAHGAQFLAAGALGVAQREAF